MSLCKERNEIHVHLNFIVFKFQRLKGSEYHTELLDQLLGTWGRLYLSDQSFLVEAVEQMLVNAQLSSALIKSLEQAATKVRSYGTDHVHAILFLETKLLSWYSTRRVSRLKMRV